MTKNLLPPLSGTDLLKWQIENEGSLSPDEIAHMCGVLDRRCSRLTLRGALDGDASATAQAESVGRAVNRLATMHKRLTGRLPEVRQCLL